MTCWVMREHSFEKLVELEKEIATYKATIAALAKEVVDMEDELVALRKSAPAIPPKIEKMLLQLCHPDKHGGAQAAHKATIWLLGQRR